MGGAPLTLPEKKEERENGEKGRWGVERKWGKDGGRNGGEIKGYADGGEKARTERRGRR